MVLPITHCVIFLHSFTAQFKSKDAHEAAYIGALDEVKGFIEASLKGVDAEDADAVNAIVDAKEPRRQQTALHRACAAGHEGIGRYLASLGADPSVEDTLGMTPIDLARGRGFTDLVNFLKSELERRASEDGGGESK